MRRSRLRENDLAERVIDRASRDVAAGYCQSYCESGGVDDVNGQTLGFCRHGNTASTRTRRARARFHASRPRSKVAIHTMWPSYRNLQTLILLYVLWTIIQ